MNCDQVFDILTRGPFPTGHRSDRAVEQHLEYCPECQRLANALRPALELFQEAISGEEGRELPGYWGGMADESEGLASPGALTQVRRRMLPREISRRIDRGRRWVSQQTGGMGLRFVAALLIGMGLAAVVWTAGMPAKNEWKGTNAIVSLPSVRNSVQAEGTAFGSASVPSVKSANREGRISLEMAEACLTGVAGPVHLDGTPITHSAAYSIAELARLNCCTRCHHALASSSHPRATTTVARSCEICHR